MEDNGREWPGKEQTRKTYCVSGVLSRTCYFRHRMMSWNGSAFCITGPLWGESTGHMDTVSVCPVLTREVPYDFLSSLWPFSMMSWGMFNGTKYAEMTHKLMKWSGVVNTQGWHLKDLMHKFGFTERVLSETDHSILIRPYMYPSYMRFHKKQVSTLCSVELMSGIMHKSVLISVYFMELCHFCINTSRLATHVLLLILTHYFYQHR